MRIIAIQGPSSCGKTSTLNLLYTLLLNRGGVSTNKQQVGADPNDFEDIVLLNGKSIAIFTVGDLGKQLVQAIHRYDSLNCDEFVCACNSKFVVAPRVINRFAHNYIHKVKAPNPSLYLAENTAYASQINNLL